jgi:hypothetical protein
MSTAFTIAGATPVMPMKFVFSPALATQVRGTFSALGLWHQRCLKIISAGSNYSEKRKRA